MGVTNDEADFTLLVVVATGHHGPHSVVHHSHNVGVIVLGVEKGVSPSTHTWSRDHKLQDSLVGGLLFSQPPLPPWAVLLSLLLALKFTGLERSGQAVETARCPSLSGLRFFSEWTLLTEPQPCANHPTASMFFLHLMQHRQAALDHASPLHSCPPVGRRPSPAQGLGSLGQHLGQLCFEPAPTFQTENSHHSPAWVFKDCPPPHHVMAQAMHYCPLKEPWSHSLLPTLLHLRVVKASGQ